MKIAIVTGASSGIGREFVHQLEHFYKELDEIWVIARREDRLQELKKGMKTYVRIFVGDMTEELVYKQVLNRLENQSPDVRMLVNAAGFGKYGTVEKIAEKHKKLQLKMIDLNCRGLTQMVTVCLPYMSKGSRIINLASAAAFCPQSGFAVYAASKSYVLSFSRALHEELKNKEIYVTAVCPGPVQTEFFEQSGFSDSFTKEAVMVHAKDVVTQALVDAREKKDVSVYGTLMKSAEVAAKVLPHKVIMKAMERF